MSDRVQFFLSDGPQFFLLICGLIAVIIAIRRRVEFASIIIRIFPRQRLLLGIVGCVMIILSVLMMLSGGEISVQSTTGTPSPATAIVLLILLISGLIVVVYLSRREKEAPRKLNPEPLSPTRPISPSAGAGDAGVETNGKIISILFLAADPTDASRLRLGEEFREIQEKLKLAKLRDRFRLELPQLSVRPADISQALLDVEPQIVHFSGHGTSTGALCFENQVGQTHLVQPDALAALFEQFTHQVNCVLLNACYSDTQAKAIAQHIRYVIGMNQAVGDKAAIAFAIGFYQALGAGRTIEDAYKLGGVQIRLQGIPEHLTPVFIRKASANGKIENTVVSEIHRSSAEEKREGVMRILYLEDDPQLVEFLPVVLQDACPELQVIGTTDIAEALARIEKEVFDGVLLDCTMPPIEDMSAEETEYGRLTGIVVARRIKTVKPDVPIVALTVISDPLLRQEMRSAGISGVITKPAEPESIIDSLLRHIRRTQG